MTTQERLFDEVDREEIHILRKIVFDLDDWHMTKDENRLRWAVHRKDEWKAKYGVKMLRQEIESAFSDQLDPPLPIGEERESK